jgi:hypothetical protein
MLVEPNECSTVGYEILEELSTGLRAGARPRENIEEDQESATTRFIVRPYRLATLHPRASRLARRHGKATPTVGESKGWIKLCNE